MNSRSASFRLPAIWLGLLLAAGATIARAGPLDAGSAPALREQHQKLAGQLSGSPLKRPMHLESTETDGGLQGDVYAVVDHPLDEVRTALANGGQWCEMLLLHINNRRCRVSKQGQGEVLTLSVVQRYDKPVEQAFELPFVHRTASNSSDYLAVRLSAESGPLGTSNYRVSLEAVPLGERQSFLHFGYSYDHNMMARLATKAYLATFGSHKMGFTVVGQKPNGEPEYIRGVRGLMERNAMRYFLTLDAYLDGLDAAPAERAEKRLHAWFEEAERYPRQLHEIDLATYLEHKRADRRRDGPKP
ncbi:hypothetical protein [Variovorax sp. JS1663]|uniref:hypothetical protein n=1 Tax=Variovorax sp. JS1663 TaxID=1851577 RepID=UPI000B344D74|nr:hypothetical protein [Variovorax sp. JS1663]OUL98392.1 hypothetical protein A8M77_31850 [Variovorax sp. JS1663]